MPVAAGDDLGDDLKERFAESSLAWLLAPLPVPTFLDEVWGTPALHHIGRADPDYFAGLLTPASAADELLAALAVAPDALRLVRGADHGDPAAHRRPDGSLDPVTIGAAIADGYTVIVNNIEKYLRPMAALTHSIEAQLNFPAHLNAYITPPGSTGFLPHYDHHDVLVLQVAGSKTWHFYGADPVPPQVMQGLYEVDPGQLPAPSTLHLTAGDTLYLPRGRVHSAQTTDEPSVHLTVGIHVPTVLTLLTHALHLLSLTDERVHTRLPPRHLDDPGLRVQLDALIGDALGAVAGPAVIDEGLGAMQDFLVRRGRGPTVGRVADTVGIGADTVVRKCRPLYSRVTRAEHGVGLQFAQLLVSAGADHEAAMHFASASTAPFRVGALPGLTDAQRIELTRSLIMSGFLVRLPADEPQSSP